MTFKELLEKHKKGKCCKCSYCCEPCYNEERNRELETKEND